MAAIKSFVLGVITFSLASTVTCQYPINPEWGKFCELTKDIFTPEVNNHKLLGTMIYIFLKSW